MTAIRLGTTVASAGNALSSNGEHHLRTRKVLARLYPRGLLEQAGIIAGLCHFSLDELRYEYPRELVPEGETPASYLRQLTETGLAWRWPDGVPKAVGEQIERLLGFPFVTGHG